MAPRYFLVGPAGARSFAEPGSGEARPLLPGFGLSVVEEVSSAGKRWAHTAQGRWVPLEALVPARPAALAGEEGSALDFAWVVTAGAPVLDAPGGHRLETRPLFARERLAGPCAGAFCRISAGWMRTEDLRAPHASARPPGVAPTERWLDVDLATQTLVAYQGDRPVFSTLVSTGIGAPGTALATPPGVFRIRSKHRTASMDNLEHTEVVPYSYQDIPLVQYFTERVALHAALWHQRFGHVASHGCVNLAPADAQRLFAFTTPRLGGGENELYVRPSTPATVIRIRR